MKICAVVVTYNAEKILSKCLESLLGQTHQLDRIFIIDNSSSDNTESVFNDKYGRNDLFKYRKLNENTGCAGGFYEAIKDGYDNGYDWIWAVDVDCVFEKDALEQLIKSEVFNKQDTGVLSCQVLDKEGNLHFRAIPSKFFRIYEKNIPATIEDYKKPYFEIQRIGFTGILMNRKVIEKSGLPMKDFFMGGDDVEYNERINQCFKTYMISDSKVVHYDDVPINEIKFLGIRKARLTPINLLWKYYYIVRNETYMRIKKFKFMRSFIYLFTGYFYLFSIIMFYENYKSIRSKILTKAFMDGIKGKLGKTIDPEKFNKELIRRRIIK